MPNCTAKRWTWPPEEIQKREVEFEHKSTTRRGELQRWETTLKEQKSSIDQKVQILKKQETDLTDKDKILTQREKTVEQKDSEVSTQLEAANRQLERVAGMTAEEARKDLDG